MMCLHVVISIGAIEFAYAKCSRFREVDEKRDGAYPLVRRLDVQFWSRWKHYPTSIIFLIFKIILIVVTTLFMVIFMKIAVIFHNFDKGPLTGYRKWLAKVTLRIYAYVMMGIFFVKMNHRKLNSDYSRYLGENYREEQGDDVKASTIVSNHVSFFDILAVYLCFEPSFCPKQSLSEAPLIGDVFKAINCVFIPRDADKDARDAVV